jgi:hypothetical protein
MTAVSLHAMSLPLQLQLPIPNPNSSMPAIVPFLDPALAAYSLAPGVLPSVSSAALYCPLARHVLPLSAHCYGTAHSTAATVCPCPMPRYA